MTVVAPIMLDFLRIVLNLYSLFFWFNSQNQGCRDKLVDVSLPIVKLSEGPSERFAVQRRFRINCDTWQKY